MLVLSEVEGGVKTSSERKLCSNWALSDEQGLAKVESVIRPGDQHVQKRTAA